MVIQLLIVSKSDSHDIMKSPYRTILILTYLLVNRRLSVRSTSAIIGSLVTRSSVAPILELWCHEYLI